jgi:hypothetical protein
MNAAISNSDVIAVAAGFIALCSLGATIWQAWISRKHNRLTVRPVLSLQRDKTIDDNAITWSFEVRNVGTGPALVKSFALTLNGDVHVPEAPGADLVKDLLKAAWGDRYRYVLRKHGVLGVGSVIASGESYVLGAVEFPGMSEAVVDAILESPVIGLRLGYESLYGERASLNIG